MKKALTFMGPNSTEIWKLFQDREGMICTCKSDQNYNARTKLPGEHNNGAGGPRNLRLTFQDGANQLTASIE